MEIVDPNTSRITLRFGDDLNHKTAFDVSINIQLFSDQSKNEKTKIADDLKVDLSEQGTIVAVFEVQGNADDLANKLNNSQETKVPHSKATFYPKGNKIYMVLLDQNLINNLQKYSEKINTLKPKTEQESKNNNITLRIQSQNNLKHLAALIHSQSYLGIANSAQLTFSFIKTKVIAEFLKIAFENFGTPQAQRLIDSFENINIEINMSSSQALKHYPKVKIPQYDKPKKQNNIVKILKEGKLSRGHLHLFHSTISLSAELVVEGLSDFLGAFFE